MHIYFYVIILIKVSQ